MCGNIATSVRRRLTGINNKERLAGHRVMGSCGSWCSFFFFSHLFCVCVGSPQSLGYLREPATTPAGWGLFAGCPRATHPTAPLGRQMGRWAPRWAARGASRRAPGALRTRPGLSSAGSRPGERPLRTTAPSLPQFRVSSVFAVDCLVEGGARLVVSPWAGLAIPSDWAHDCGVHRDLGALPYGESIGDNLYAPSVAGWYVKG